MSDPHTKAAILDSHADSIRTQMGQCTLSMESSNQIVDALSQSAFKQETQDALKRCLAQRLVQRTSPGKPPKRSTQALKDIGPFLKESDVTYLACADHTLAAKVARVASVFVQVGCTNPTEQSSGKAMAYLHKECGVAALSDAQTFYQSVQEFKAAVKSHAKTQPLPSTHLTMYSTPEALPADLHDRAYSAEPPVGQPGTTLGGNVGPLRGSHTSIKATKKSAQPPVLVTTAADSMIGPNSFFSSMAQMLTAYAQNGHAQPQQQQPQITMTTPKQQLALQDVQQSSPPRAETAHGDLASPAASANEPLTPKMQAEAMLAAWDMRSEQRKAEQTAQEDDGNNDNQKDEKGAGGKKVVPKKKPAGKITVILSERGRLA